MYNFIGYLTTTLTGLLWHFYGSLLGPRNEHFPSISTVPLEQPQEEISEANSKKCEHILITHMHATELASGLRRLPAGFYVAVEFDEIVATTSNKTVSVGKDVAEWDEEVVLPSTRSSVISFEVYASYEHGPRIGSGELLGRFEMSVGEILDRSERLQPIMFLCSRNELSSSCLSLGIVAERRDCNGSECRAKSEAARKSEAEELTDEGHRALLCYRQDQDQAYLDKAIRGFQRVHDDCSVDHPHRSAVLFNLANAMFIHCQVNNHDVGLDEVIVLYRDALHLRTTGHPDHVTTVLELGFALLARFQRRGHEADRMEAMDFLGKVVELTPADSHTHQAGWLALEMAKAFVSLQEGDAEISQDADTTELIDRARAMVRASSHSDPEHPILLADLGTLLYQRFEENEEPGDIHEAISMLDEAAQLVPSGHADKPEYLNKLGIFLESRFERLGDTADMKRSILILEGALCLTPDDHPDKPGWLSNLGISLLNRSRRLGDIADVTKSISVLEEAVRLTPDGHQDKPSWLNNLGISLLSRFGRIGDVADLTKSISMKEEAVRLTPDDHPDKPILLDSLGNTLSRRFERLGDVTDITRSVSLSEEAVLLIPDSHPLKTRLLNNLGNRLSSRFERLGDVTDTTRSVSIFEEAIRLIPDDHPDKPCLLNNFGNLLLLRFGRLGDIADITKSILMEEEAVRLTPDGHPDRPSRLNNLGNSLSNRFARLDDVADITQSVLTFEAAVRLTRDGHADKPAQLDNLGVSLSRRFDRLGDVTDITKSVSIFEEAVRLTPDGHPDKPCRLNNLGNSLFRRFDRLGDITDIMESVSMEEEAVRLTPDDHPDKSSRLNNLGNTLSRRFECLGDIADMTKSISMQEEAVRLIPDGHPDTPYLLNSLGDSLLNRFQHLDDIADISKSALVREKAVRLTPDDHPDKPSRLSGLGNSLLIRFQRLYDIADITKSVVMQEEAIRLSPDGHPDKPSWFNNLGISLLDRFERFGDVTDIMKSVSMFEAAVHLTPNSHPDKRSRLNNLGCSISRRFRRLGDVADIAKSVTMIEEAVRLTPDGHPGKPGLLSNLGDSLLDHAELFGDIADITKSISIKEEAIRLTPDGHPDKPTRLYTLGLAFRSRSNHLCNASDLIAATSHFSSAAQSSTGPTFVRFQAARCWISSAEVEENSRTLLDAYTTALDLLPQLAWMGLPLTERHRVLIDAADVTRGAAAAALEAGHSEMAVEWLEQGRSIVWTQFLQLRTPVDLLRVSHPALADEFEQTSKQLENASTRDRLLSDELLGREPWPEEEIVQKHHALTLRREKLLAKIRSLPDFDRFLLPKTINQLAALVHSGPVVYLNATKSRCDALIVMAGRSSVVHVPLHGVTYAHVRRMHHLLLDHNCATVSIDDVVLLSPSSSSTRDAKARMLIQAVHDREGRLKTMEVSYDRFQLVLEFLWREVASPVLETLGLSTPALSLDKMTRILWCPTGPFAFLPIHAAGLYSAPPAGPKLSDFAISSYIPTLGSFQSLTKRDPSDQTFIVRLATVPQPPNDGQFRLCNVEKEIDHIRTLCAKSHSITLQHSDGTVEDAMSKMASADWVHFACHGVQDPVHPLDSGLCLADRRRLKLSDIIRLSRPQGGLAFLSACQTAAGDEKLSEESVHLAAGMLLAGYGGVIATMWSIMDNDAPKVARDVYQHLFRDGKVPDTTEAAEALHRAIVRLRDEDKVPFASWVPFIHLGR